jgi:hypothetical protein
MAGGLIRECFTYRRVMMKKNGVFWRAPVLLPVLAILLAGAGCSTTYHYEKDAPVETQAALMWMGKEIKAVALDEAGVSWKVKSFLFVIRL